MVENWDSMDFALHLLVHFLFAHKALINTANNENNNCEAEELEPKARKQLLTTCEFIGYLCLFLQSRREYCQSTLLDANANEAGSIGIGLTMVRAVCAQFKQKTGKYNKVKKQLSVWAKDVIARHEQEKSYNPIWFRTDSQLVSEFAKGNWHPQIGKFVSDESGSAVTGEYLSNEHANHTLIKQSTTKVQ